MSNQPGGLRCCCCWCIAYTYSVTWEAGVHSFTFTTIIVGRGLVHCWILSQLARFVVGKSIYYYWFIHSLKIPFNFYRHIAALPGPATLLHKSPSSTGSSGNENFYLFWNPSSSSLLGLALCCCSKAKKTYSGGSGDDFYSPMMGDLSK